jgi:hypothetical protein
VRVNGCPDSSWTFDSDYVTNNAVNATMHIEVSDTFQPPNLLANGTFTISTSSGTIAGSVAGTQHLASPMQATFVLTP